MSVAYSPNGQQIISGSGDRTIRIWDAKTGAVLGTPLRGHSDVIWSVAYSPSGQHIVSGSEDGTIRVWDSFAHLPSNLPHLVTQCIPNFVLSQTQMVGSETLRVAYYIGYPQIVVQACIHLLSSQSL
jgi:WD40 repeat protein